MFSQGQIHHKRRSFYADNFLCLFSPEQLKLSPPISLEDYLRVPHVLTSLTDDAHGAVDEALAKLKLKRTIAMTTPGFLAVPFVLRRAPVITTMPSRLARYFAEAFGLATSPAPIELPSFTISLLWHASFDQDPGHVWLRQTVVWARLRGRRGTLKRRLNAGVDKCKRARLPEPVDWLHHCRLIDSFLSSIGLRAI